MSLYRRLVLLSCLSWPLAGFSATALTNLVAEPFAKLEQDFGGSIGVYAMDTGSGATVSYRAEERFPLCSSFKGFLAAAVLARSQQQAGLLDTPIRYGKNALVPWSPISEKYLTTGMTVAELSAAAVQYSDNAAANLLLKELGGPAGLTAFMRSIGDTTFRLDRWELELNSAIPGDARDTSSPRAVTENTSSPRAVTESLQKLTLGSALAAPQRQQFVDWLKGNTTGNHRIRAAVPADWAVGDKTGTCGVYGTANDYAVVWPTGRAPIVLAVYTRAPNKDDKHSEAVYTRAPNKDDKHSEAVIAAAARLALEGLGVNGQ
ncbi:class A beta-lactamase KPC-108 (plasmid) [Klebsiella pneumoniae subsp. pneumoniae]|uniref:class A beta-lactamase KPC-108 n=1 Tax=Klebsiella pneumoniae TaxID=573 RepID=UPI001E45DDD6|nr:class A beta-lactamase KPC-108 [Klebsiella pneumoniae]UFK32674.1 carbapenem-hydrolyzing class A beta-lactamase KPC-108 [Klebsiella pneumoniae subsp. pneumoniae]